MSLHHSPRIVYNGLYSLYDTFNYRSYNPKENLLTTAGAFNYPINNFNSANTQLDLSPFNEIVLCKHDFTGLTSSPFMNARVGTTLAPGVYTISAWFKGSTNFSAAFAYIGETVSETPATTINITTAWQRFSYTFTLINTQNAGRVQLFFGTQGIDKIVSIYGVQIQSGSYAGEYTPTSGGTPIIRSTIFSDLVKGNNLTVYGKPNFNSGKYFTFANNQTTQYLMNDNYLNPSIENTYSVWFRTNNTDSGQIETILTNNNTTFTNNLLLHTNNNTSFNWYVKNTSYTYTSPTSMKNVWVNLVRTFNSRSGITRVYVNGSPVGQNTATASADPVKTSLIIGQEADSAGGTFDPAQNLGGDFSHLMVYDRALSDNEVKQNFNALRARYGV
jgi:hypothetical protein